MTRDIWMSSCALCHCRGSTEPASPNAEAALHWSWGQRTQERRKGRKRGRCLWITYPSKRARKIWRDLAHIVRAGFKQPWALRMVLILDISEFLRWQRLILYIWFEINKKIYLKVFIWPRVAELFIHKEKQRGCPLLGSLLKKPGLR